MEKLLFTNVMLYDGTGRTPFMADVAVQDDRIAAVAECGTLNKTGAQIIDGNGLALTPGFVDVHTHSDSSAARVPGGDSKISQGVTTDISGNCGFSFYLTGAKDAEDVFKGTWCNFGAYADAIEKSCPAVNVVHLCGHNSLRVRVMGYEERNATREELRQMKELLAEALEHGAGGFSGGPYYLPGKFAPTEELKELASLLKGTGKPYATHIRNEASNLLEALDEAFEIARAGDNNLEISHLKTSGEKNWCKLDAVFEKIEKARAEGMNVLADRYPYIHSSTGLRQIVPPPFDTVDTMTLCGKLKESAAYRQELLAAMKKGLERSPARTLLVSSPFEEHKKYRGMSMVEIGNLMGCSGEEAVVNLLAAGNTPWAAFGTMNEENLEKILAKPYVITGSDGSIRAFDDNTTHPRAFGTCPLFFRIASKNCDYSSVIRRMTALPAAKFNLEGRGIVAPGYFADLVLLDLDKFDSKADYAVPNRRAEGITAVYVNGKLAYSPDEGIKTNRAGRMLRIK